MSEAQAIFLREREGGAVELCIKQPGEELIVYVLRVGQLANLAIDATRFALRRRDSGHEWDAMWEKKFDYPERL